MLENLTPAGVTRFRLPKRQIPILVIPHAGDAVQLDPVVDTVLIEPDQGRLMLTWRTSMPLAKSIFDIKRVVIEQTLRKHLDQTRRSGKTHYANLGEMVRPEHGPRSR